MISILCPSRGRPANLRRLADSLRSTTRGRWELVVRLDVDDPLRDDYLADWNAPIQWIVEPRGILSAAWNECAEAATGDILMMCADDIVFRTDAWDEKVATGFPADRIAFVHGDDRGDRGTTFGTHGFVSRRWVEIAGEFVPAVFVSDYADRWLNDIANILDRRIYVPIITEHMHPGFGKAPIDQTHLERLKRHQEHPPEDIYRSTAAYRLRVAENLLRAMRP